MVQCRFQAKLWWTVKEQKLSHFLAALLIVAISVGLWYGLFKFALYLGRTVKYL